MRGQTSGDRNQERCAFNLLWALAGPTLQRTLARSTRGVCSRSVFRPDPLPSEAGTSLAKDLMSDGRTRAMSAFSGDEVGRLRRAPPDGENRQAALVWTEHWQTSHAVLRMVMPERARSGTNIACPRTALAEASRGLHAGVHDPHGSLPLHRIMRPHHRSVLGAPFITTCTDTSFIYNSRAHVLRPKIEAPAPEMRRSHLTAHEPSIASALV